VAKRSRPPQFELTQFHSHTIQRVGGNLSVLRKQAQCRVALFFLDKHVQRFPPGGLLLVVDLAQIQHCPLRRFAARYAAVLDHAEVAMLFAVLLAVCAVQKHLKQQHARKLGV
jgi:hypothetical protein